jgi:hypothetical protein
MSPTARCCPICSMATKPACRATRRIAACGQGSVGTPRGRRTSSIAAIAIAALWMRSSGRKTEPNRRCGPRSSIRSGSSSECSALPRCAIAGSKRTLIASSSPVRSPICSSRVGIYCAARRRRVPALRQPTAETIKYAPRRCRRAPCRRLTKFLCPLSTRQPLVQTFLSRHGASRRR